MYARGVAGHTHLAVVLMAVCSAIRPTVVIVVLMLALGHVGIDGIELARTM